MFIILDVLQHEWIRHCISSLIQLVMLEWVPIIIISNFHYFLSLSSVQYMYGSNTPTMEVSLNVQWNGSYVLDNPHKITGEWVYNWTLQSTKTQFFDLHLFVYHKMNFDVMRARNSYPWHGVSYDVQWRSLNCTWSYDVIS